jgi:hypothetical protein
LRVSGPYNFKKIRLGQKSWLEGIAKDRKQLFEDGEIIYL